MPANAQSDTALAWMTGVTGWILPLLFIGVLVLTRRLPTRNPLDLADANRGVDTPAPAGAELVGVASAN